MHDFHPLTCWVGAAELRTALPGLLVQSALRWQIVVRQTPATHDDDDVHVYSTATPCCCSMLGALGRVRVVSLEACS